MIFLYKRTWVICAAAATGRSPRTIEWSYDTYWSHCVSAEKGKTPEEVGCEPWRTTREASSARFTLHWNTKVHLKSSSPNLNWNNFFRSSEDLHLTSLRTANSLTSILWIMVKSLSWSWSTRNWLIEGSLNSKLPTIWRVEKQIDEVKSEESKVRRWSRVRRKKMQ